MRIVVVGAGISGLAAAWRARAVSPHADVVVLESTGSVGGKVTTAEVAGHAVDVGAEALLVRNPVGTDLVTALGLAEDLITPLSLAASVFAGGTRHPLPGGTMFGVPGDVAEARASGLFSRAALDRIVAEREDDSPPPLTEDVPVGRLVRARLGDEVADRLLEPLLGGVYAGRAERISLDAALPALAARLRSHGGSLVSAAAAVVQEGRRRAVDGPAFVSLRGGLGRLTAALAAAGRFEVRTGVTVTGIARTQAGFRVTTGATNAREVLDADKVIVAVPARKAAVLLRDVAPVAANELAGVETASVAIVTLAFDTSALATGAGLPAGSGLLVAPTEGYAVKGVTFSSQKWPLSTGGLTVLRASLGRLGESVVLQRDDDELTRLARSDLTRLIGLTTAPVDSRVTRWAGGLPQYDVGHLARVARIRSAVSAVPGLGVCGAVFDGVGIPACIGSAYRAVAQAGLTADDQEMRVMSEGRVDGRTARELNEVIRYTAWSVFVADRPLGDLDRGALAVEVGELFEQLASKDITVRGTYDVSALRADADLMIWWHAPSAEALQEAYGRFRRTSLGAHLRPVWSSMALHRPAEFNRSHIPAFLADEHARRFVCVYPFVRSYDWYLLDEPERRRLLAEHGKMARDYPDVRANTVASFALGDYEWMLAFEADELHRIVDLMRHLRGSETRRHVREEVPFYTGTRRDISELVAALP